MNPKTRKFKPVILQRLLSTVKLFVPIALHFYQCSFMNLLGMEQNPSSSHALAPDVASLLFVAALEITLDTYQNDQIPGAESKIVHTANFLVDSAISVIYSDLVLRFVWIPFQYGLYFSCIKGNIAALLSTVFFFLKYSKFSTQFDGLLKISQTEAGFIVLRNTLTVLLFIASLMYSGCLQFIIRRIFVVARSPVTLYRWAVTKKQGASKRDCVLF